MTSRGDELRALHPLDYAGRQSRSKRGRFALIAILAALLALLGGEIARRWFVPKYNAYRDMQLQLAWEAKCRSYQAPRNLIVYTRAQQPPDEMKAEDRRLWNNGNLVFGESGKPTAWYSFPLAWDQNLTLRTHNTPVYLGNAFLHERHLVGGTPRLIAVDIRENGDYLDFLCTCILPGSTPLPRSTVEIPILRKWPKSPDFTVYAGEPNPADPARFVIRCVTGHAVNGKRIEETEFLDGRLNGDGTVSLVPRDGYNVAGDINWEILLPDGNLLTPWDSPLRAKFGGGPQTTPSLTPTR